MANSEKQVDGYRFLPPGLAAWVRTFIPREEYSGTIPWTPLSRPLGEARVALVTSAGISLRKDPPFDMEREKKDPLWGDPTYRLIPKGTTENEIDVNHLHINTTHIRKDINVILPLQRMEELEKEGFVGTLVPTSYSFYGFQWQGTEWLATAIEPMVDRMKEERVEAVFLTPA